jgi:hypothetical protein
LLALLESGFETPQCDSIEEEKEMNVPEANPFGQVQRAVSMQ